ncbi:protein kinase-like protein [Lotmaria passim]
MGRGDPMEQTLYESSRAAGEEFPLRFVARSRDTGSTKSRLRAVKRYLLRMDVCWTAFFFSFLVCVAVIITSITRTQVPKSTASSWREIHFTRRALYDKMLDIELEKAHRIAATLMAANLRKPLAMRSEKTLSVVCATLVAFDTESHLRAVLVASAASKETVTCIHGITSVGSKDTLTGYISHNSIVKGTYYIDNKTYEFARPLVVATAWPERAWNISASMSASLMSRDAFRQALLYYQRLIHHVDRRKLWFYFARMPHMFYYNVPTTLIARGFDVSSSYLNDFAQVRIDGSALLSIAKYMSARGARAVILVNQSLHTSDPLIFSTNYGQTAVNNTNVYSASADDTVTYLKTSEVSDPLMRAALKHVNFKAMQQEGYERTTEFYYRGAPAIVTAYTRTTNRGLILPIVMASAQITATYGYIRTLNVWLAIVAIVVVALTALFYWFVHISFSRPLERMTRIMLGNLQTGHRKLYRVAGRTMCAQLSEVAELIQAHDAAARRLRIIDKFIPLELRARAGQLHNAQAEVSADDSTSFLDEDAEGRDKLLRQLLTVVYITIHSPTAPTTKMRDVVTVSQEVKTNYRQGRRLAAVVDSAAHAAQVVSSGPFSSPAALDPFLSKVQDLSEACDGVVHRLSPDSCVVHFGAAVRAQLLRRAAHKSTSAMRSIADTVAEEVYNGAAMEEFAALDAYSALRFALALQEWYTEDDQHQHPFSPDVRVLVDTSTFICGHYRPAGSEQTLSIALGRDVQRSLGHVLETIGVRVAMTEETAKLVRTERMKNSAARAVRQIPVESLHIGRPGLNADIVVLYEALPGAADDDDVWQQYRWCCFRGFAYMLRGNYAGALSAFKEVAGISDLEPGLLPRSLRREAAASSVVGEAVSTQVERLMQECERRVRAGDTRSFSRKRCDPLGIDAVLQGVCAIGELPARQRHKNSVRDLTDTPNHVRSTRAPGFTLFYPRANERYVVEQQTRLGLVRSVVASPPEWLQDNVGLYWKTAKKAILFTPGAAWQFFSVLLGSAGALAALGFFAFRDIPLPVANAITDAPLGPMSDELRSATPVFDATPQQKATLRILHTRQCQLQHPNLLEPLSYSFAVEGGAVFVWEYNSGGTLRELAARYYRIKPVTTARFMHGIISAIAYLHKRGVAHGSVSLDSILVGADGVCRLRGHCTDVVAFNKLVIVPRFCYVSPAMAAGAMPTPACDMFCYGLMCIELLSGAKAWKWAAAAGAVAEEGQQQQQQPVRSEEELGALMADAGQPFYDAVADGRIVPNTDVLDTLTLTTEVDRQSRDALRACLSHDPAERPTALRARQLCEALLAQEGVGLSVDLPV